MNTHYKKGVEEKLTLTTKIQKNIFLLNQQTFFSNEFQETQFYVRKPGFSAFIGITRQLSGIITV